MDVGLSTVKWQHALVNIDDIIVFWKTLEEQLRHIEELHKLLNYYGMTIKLKKCSFFGENIDYLSHVIAPSKLQVATKTTEAIKVLQYLAAVTLP